MRLSASSEILQLVNEGFDHVPLLLLRGLKDHGEVRAEADIGLHVAAENEAPERRRYLLCGNLEHVEHVRVNRLLRPMHVQEGNAVAQITEE